MLTLLSAGAPSSSATERKRAPLIKGNLSENIANQTLVQTKALGFAVKKMADGRSIVSEVRLGSSAAYRGLKAGDELIGLSVQESKGLLTGSAIIQRQGKRFVLELTARGDYNRSTDPLPPTRDQTASVSIGSSSSQELAKIVTLPTTGLTQNGDDDQTLLKASAKNDLIKGEVERAFRGRDLVILIDRSGSMETTDCPRASSRWKWCHEEVSDVSRQTEVVLPDGFTLVLFNGQSKSFPATSVESIESAFKNNNPEGGTDIEGALLKVLKDNANRCANSKQQRALLLAVITDGVPNDERSLRRALISAANGLTSVRDLSIVFLQVGEDNQASAFLEDLDRNLIQQGAKFDVVKSVIFADVKRDGLLKSLAQSVN